MNNLDLFIKNLCGKFNNNEQISTEISNNNIVHPKATHINGVINNKILNLPNDFKGYFVLEESYYEQGNFKNILPHLFLFELNKDNNVILTSYELPDNIDKEDFRNNNTDLTLDFNTLKISKKFTPMVYKLENGVFKGESISNFSPKTKFILKESIGSDTLEVSEVFMNDDKITFGFLDPIIYKRI